MRAVRPTTRLPVLLVVASLSTVSACGGYDRDDTVRSLMKRGMDQETAECIADGFEAEIGTDRLGQQDEPTTEEREIINEITTICLLGE